MSELFDRHMAVDPGYAYAAILLLLAVGLRFRAKPVLFGLAFFGLAYLPLGFVGARSPYAIHLSVAGLALAAGGALDLVTRVVAGGRLEIPRRLALLAGLVWGLVVFNSRPNLFNYDWMTTESRLIRGYIHALERARFGVPAHGKVLLLNDPLKQWEWASTFAAQLHYGDPYLMVIGEDRVPFLQWEKRDWDQVWRWRESGLERVAATPAASPAGGTGRR
jgi:hypothetical protein